MAAVKQAREITVRPLTGAVGAEISGVDLGRLDAETFAAVRAAFLDHCVLVFPGRHLGPADQRAFARLWGEPTVLPYLTAHAVEGFPEILRVTNPGKDKVLTEQWHTDSPYFERPPAITILAAQELPATGGDTMFANQYRAYEALSDGMKELLQGLRLAFIGSRPAPDGTRQAVSVSHPIVRTHPETGRKSLYLGHPGDSVGAVDGMTDEESRPLLDYLFAHASRPDFCYRHRWGPGDVLMWDNRCTLHYAVHDYGDAARLLHRVTIEGDEPR